jgi:BASS family bile acid:Na+ symporter
MIRAVTGLFPVWALLLSAVAYGFPAPFVAAKEAISPLLGVVMLTMGLTLTRESFTLVLRRPSVVAVGVLLQFGAMPLLAWLSARALGLPASLMAGLVLVGACPGGTASNVITFLARGDVALSITLTAVSTVLSVVVTPLVTWVYLGRSVDVPVLEMLLSILWIVLVPVAVGTVVNTRLGHRLRPIAAVFPAVSVAAIVVIIAIIVALTADRLPAVGLAVFVAVALHNAGGLATGYGAGRILGFSRAECRTLAIEVGMQNSGLGVALATRYFSTLASVPGAVFSIWHNLSGAGLAAWWARVPHQERYCSGSSRLNRVP